MLPVMVIGLLVAVSVSGNEEKLDLSGELAQDDCELLEANSTEQAVTQGGFSSTCRCGLTNRASRRIVGGKVHAPNEYPFVAGIADGNKQDYPHCGGAIISEWHVLTVAHCTKDAKSLIVTVGDYDRSGRTDCLWYIPVAWIYEHELYQSGPEYHDICLLVLEWKIIQKEHVGLVCMPTGPMNLVGKQVKIMGWGSMGPGSPMTTLPQEVDLEVVDFDLCFHGFIYTNRGFQMCTLAPGKNTCSGDSGSPVVYLDPQTNRYVLVGLVSFGPNCRGGEPSVQTYVPAYLPWILSKIQSTTPNLKLCS